MHDHSLGGVLYRDRGWLAPTYLGEWTGSVGWLLVLLLLGGLGRWCFQQWRDGSTLPRLIRHLPCDVSGLDGKIWEITLDEEAFRAWVYKPEVHGSTEYPATFTPEQVRLGKELLHTGSYLSNVLDRPIGALTSEIRGLSAASLSATRELQAKTSPTA